MANRCNHIVQELVIIGYKKRKGEEFGQVHCTRCRTRWSMHAKEKNVTRFIHQLRATNKLQEDT